MVVYAGTLDRVLREASAEAAQTRVILVYEASASLARKHAPLHARFSLAADEHGTLRRSYNAFFLPRAYVLRQGRLQWAQTEPGLPAETVAAEASKFVVSND